MIFLLCNLLELTQPAGLTLKLGPGSYAYAILIPGAIAAAGNYTVHGQTTATVTLTKTG